MPYVAFGDMASGSGKDATTIGIAGRVGEKAVLFVLRAWKPPFNPSGVIAEAAELLKTYGLREVTMDRYAGGFPVEQFRSHSVKVVPSTRDRSQIYLDVLPLVNAGRVVLLDQPDLLRELRGLERRRGPSGRDRVDHRAGLHDDSANSAAGALVLVGQAPRLDLARILESGDQEWADRRRQAEDGECEEQEFPGSQSFSKLL